MIRTQIQLTEAQAQKLKRLAAERGVSMATLVREGVERVVGEDDDEKVRLRALSVVGAFRGGAGELVSEQHDRHLEQAYAGWRSS